MSIWTASVSEYRKAQHTSPRALTQLLGGCAVTQGVNSCSTNVPVTHVIYFHRRQDERAPALTHKAKPSDACAHIYALAQGRFEKAALT